MKPKLVVILLILTKFIFAQNVIVAVIDGARYTETFGAEATNIPHIWNDLKPQGTIYTNYLNTGITSTNPGHATMLTGTWQSIANDGSQRPTKPTVFEYFRKEKSALELDNYVVAGKAKLNMMSYSTFEFYGVDYTASVSATDISDNEVYAKLVTIMDDHQPKLIIVNFPGVDRAGHTADWADYISAIKNVDILINQLWIKIQNDVNYQNNTTLFVTNDHGRHSDGTSGGFSSHGDGCEGCTHLMLLALGRNVTPNQTIADPRLQIDIAPTIGDLLSFSTPEATGTSLFGGSNPLPVELINFTYSLDGGRVVLNWQTATEVDNYGFEIERNTPIHSPSQEGNELSDSGVWETIGFVLGHGNSSSPKSYEYTDNLITGSGEIYYRLKQIDNGGTFVYSDMVEVSIVPLEHELTQNYPNPFNPTTTIDYSLPEDGNVQIKIFNSLGEEIKTLVSQERLAGYYSVQWDGINRSGQKVGSGLYFYSIKSNDFYDVKKMIFLK